MDRVVFLGRSRSGRLRLGRASEVVPAEEDRVLYGPRHPCIVPRPRRAPGAAGESGVRACRRESALFHVEHRAGLRWIGGSTIQVCGDHLVRPAEAFSEDSAAKAAAQLRLRIIEQHERSLPGGFFHSSLRGDLKSHSHRLALSSGADPWIAAKLEHGSRPGWGQIREASRDVLLQRIGQAVENRDRIGHGSPPAESNGIQFNDPLREVLEMSVDRVGEALPRLP